MTAEQRSRAWQRRQELLRELEKLPVNPSAQPSAASSRLRSELDELEDVLSVDLLNHQAVTAG